MGWNLIESEDTGTRQYVITKLGAETGLAVIKTLKDIIDANQKDETTVSIFRDRTLPFYRIISHPDVLSSLILETPVNTIYTFLFGSQRSAWSSSVPLYSNCPKWNDFGTFFKR
jgi:hypothetical protein